MFKFRKNPHINNRKHIKHLLIGGASTLVAVAVIAVGSMAYVSYNHGEATNRQLIRTQYLSRRVHHKKLVKFPKALQGYKEIGLPISNPALRPYYRKVLLVHITPRRLIEQPLMLKTQAGKYASKSGTLRGVGYELKGCNAITTPDKVTKHGNKYRLSMYMSYWTGEYIPVLKKAGIAKSVLVSPHTVSNSGGTINLDYNPKNQQFSYQKRALKPITKQIAKSQLDEQHIPFWWITSDL